MISEADYHHPQSVVEGGLVYQQGEALAGWQGTDEPLGELPLRLGVGEGTLTEEPLEPSEDGVGFAEFREVLGEGAETAVLGAGEGEAKSGEVALFGLVEGREVAGDGLRPVVE